MAAICYSGPISAIPTNEQLLDEKTLYAKFKIDISKTKRLVRVYTNGRTGRQMDIKSARLLISNM